MIKTQKGFTLIELLVVIAIIGILSGILFYAIDPKKQTDKAKDSNIKSAIASIRTRANLIYTQEFSYKNIVDDLSIKKIMKTIPSGDIDANEKTWAVLGLLNNDKNNNPLGKYKIYCADSLGFIGYVKGSILTTHGVIKCTDPA